MNLYYHKTDGGAEYLTDKFIEWEHNGKKGKEGIFEGAKYIVRIDGDITKDAELSVREDEEAPRQNKKTITRMKNSISLINTVVTSCEEGKDGRWDCSTDEGKEGFDAMIELLESVKLILLAEKKDRKTITIY